MKFPHAHAGVKKLFICEIIGIAASILAIVGAVLAAIGLKDPALLATGGSVVLASTIALIVVFVLQLVGLHQGGKDELQMKYAFYLTILGVVLGVVSSILSSVSKSDGMATAVTFVNAAQSVAALLASYYVLMGISALAGKLKDEKMEKQGRRLATWVIAFFCVSIVFEVFGGIFKANQANWLVVTATILAIVAAVAELVVYIITFVYYGKAVKMLKK